MNALQLDSMLTYGIVFAIGMLAGILALLAVEHVRERLADAAESRTDPLASEPPLRDTKMGAPA